MGQLSLIFVVAAFLLSGIVVYNASQSANRADEKVWEHQYHVFARDAASTGMAATTRRLAQNLNTAWGSGLATTLTQTPVAYNGGTYSVEATAAPNSCSLLNATNYAAALTGFIKDGDIIEVRATGTYQGDVGGDAEQSHQLVACYMKADWSLFAPPAFNYGFISDDQFTFNGGPDIQALVEGEGHIHSNDYMYLGPQVDVDGHATYVNEGDIHHNADVASHGTGSDIPMEPFDATEFATTNNIPDACTIDTDRCLYSAGFSSDGDQTIMPPTRCPIESSDHCVNEPFIWYIDGDFVLGGDDHITVPQYTTIVVNGNISVSGTAALTVTGQTVYDLYGNNPTDEQMRAWVISQLFDGEHSPIAWYAGSLDESGNVDPTTGNVDINGTSALVGNFYVNGDVELNGGGQGNNTVGSFASTTGDITANGGGNGNNFWFLEVAEENVIPGVMLPGKQIVRLALAEWTDAVLDN